jgi:hypothetical protein
MKRIVSLLLALSMVLSLCVSAFAVDYSDLEGENMKYAGAVDALTELKVIDGFPDETFRPNDNLTRAQVAKMLVICLGLGDSVESLSGKTVFSDVASNYWASGYINAAAQSKIIVGYPDGTFKPENQVTYAEAFTMALRALGYGNVVEAEGTWPTAYLLKAVELELNDDMDPYTADKPATRGNTAILLWNMLRTPMWKIYQESQGNGMTLEARTDLMLNVKFPKYWYEKAAYLTDYTVSNTDKMDQLVRATLAYVDEKGLPGTWTGYVKVDTDISRFVLGMKVSALIKDYKDEEKLTFLTITPEYSFVEGLVTSIENLDADKLEIEKTEYKLNAEPDTKEALAENVFVVGEVDGKKVQAYEEDLVMKTLPDEGKEVAKPSTLRSKIDEDALVIIDGKWARRDDIEEGDVYTELNEDNDQVTGDAYYMVARNRVAGTFESLTFEKDDDQRMYFEVDGAQYKTTEKRIKGNVYEGEDETKVEDEVAKLTKKKSDNDYLDKEIELVLNYLGRVVKAYFGDVKGNGNGNNFFAVMSNGIRVVTDPETGDTALKIRLANGEDEEGTMYKFSSKFKEADFVDTLIEKDEVFDNAEGDSGEGVFVWVKFNDKDEIKAIAVLEAGLSGDPYDDDYAFVEFNEEYDKTNGYLTTDDGEFKVTSATTVFKLTPEIDEEDDQVVGFKFEVAEDAKAALQGVDHGLVAYDTTSKINKNKEKMTASFVFITMDAVSADLEVGKVEKTKESRGISYVQVDGEWEEVDLENKKSIVDEYKGDDGVEGLDKNFIVFSRTENGKVVVKGCVSPEQLAGASIVEAVEGSIVQLTEGELSGDIDLEKKDDELNKKYEDYQIVAIEASVDKDDKVEFDGGENLGEGLPAGKYSKGDRVLVDNDLEVIYIVTVEGVDEEDVINDDGSVTYADEVEAEDEDEDETETYTVTYSFAANTPAYVTEATQLPGDVTKNSGETYEVVEIPDVTITSGEHSGEVIEFNSEPAAGTQVSGDTEVVVTAIL